MIHLFITVSLSLSFIYFNLLYLIHHFYLRRDATLSSELEAEAGEESDSLDSTAKPSSEANSRRRSTVENMPAKSEIEDFFAEAEKKLVKQFSQK